MIKGIIYYTDNLLEDPIYSLVQEYLMDSGLEITSASLKPMEFGNNEVVRGKRGYPTMVRQIISCLERSIADNVFFCEHDVLYHPSHFDFTPSHNDIFYYNENVWRWEFGKDIAFRHDRMLSLSSLCVDREFALDHYNRRLKHISERGLDTGEGGQPKWVRVMGYEPGTKKKKRGGFSDDDFETWSSDYPCIDIRHGGTFSSPKTKLEDFTHKPKWWKEISVEDIDGWKLGELFS